MQTLKILVEGRVQRVGYRHYIYTKAKRLQLRGYVRNLDNGKVEILAIGEGTSISSLIKQAKKGPTLSWVYNVQVYAVEQDMSEHFNDFLIVENGSEV
jgi:acylphosphatase